MARIVKSPYLGCYIIAEREHNGRPVYRNGNGKHLWSQEDGTWAASWDVGNIWPVMRSTTAAVSPGLCQHWQYWADWKYKPGDITVTLIYNIPKFECVNV